MIMGSNLSFSTDVLVSNILYIWKWGFLADLTHALQRRVRSTDRVKRARGRINPVGAATEEKLKVRKIVTS
jgi:hypothetical protein